MTKKLLSAILSVALLFAIHGAIPVSADENTVIGGGYIVEQDFTNPEDDTFRTVYPAAVEDYVDSKGDLVDLTLDSTGQNAYSAVTLPNSEIDFEKLPSEYTVELDLNVINCSAPFIVGFNNPSLGTNAAYAVRFLPGVFADLKADAANANYQTKAVYGNPEVNKWFNIRIEINEENYNLSTHNGNSSNNGVFNVYYRERGTDEWLVLPAYVQGNFAELKNFRPLAYIYAQLYTYCSDTGMYFKVMNDGDRGCVTYRDAELKVPNNKTDAHYQVDNVRVYAPGVSVGGFRFESNGETADAVPEGEVAAVFEMNNLTAKDETVSAAIAAYNTDGKMVAFSGFETLTLPQGTSGEYSTRAIDLEGLDNVERVELLVWDSADGMRPMGKSMVIGTAKGTESSTTTANFGTATTVTSREYDIEYLDRATIADRITVEGATDAGVESEIAFIVKGSNSQQTVYAGQITTDENGTFKTTFEVNCDLLDSSDTEVTICISGADVNPKVMNIPAFSDWSEFRAAFEEIDSAEDMKNFYSNYEKNLTYYKSGENLATTVDISDFTSEDWKTMFVILDNTDYTDFVNAEIVNEAYRMVGESFLLVEPFLDAVNAAKNTEGDLSEKAEAVKTALETNSPIEFSYGAASNKLAVCEVLAEIPDFDTLEELVLAFNEAVSAQTSLEESAISGFKGINSSESMKAFFASENGVTLGVSASDIDENGDDKEWEPMYKAYVANSCAQVTNVEEMATAIDALRTYLIDLDEFLKKADNATMAEELKALLEADYSENTYFDKEMSKLKADGMNLEGVGNSDYFYAKLLEKLLEEDACGSIESVAAKYAMAKASQQSYEAEAVAALNGAKDKDTAKTFFADYAELFGQSKDYTHRQITVFGEINEYKGTNVATFGEAKTVLSQLIADAVTMTAVLDEMKAVPANEWQNLKELFEGEGAEDVTVIERYIGSVETASVADVRALYLRIINSGCTFETIAEALNAFDAAYDAQLEWEEHSGVYESTDPELADFDESAWKMNVMANVITIEGKVAEIGAHRLVFVVTVPDTGDSVILFKQIKTGSNGAFSVKFVLNPEMAGYVSGNDKGLIRIVSNTVNTYRFPMIDLYSDEELEAVVSEFKSISNVGELESFVQGKYGEMLNIKEIVNDLLGENPTADDKTKVYDAMLFAYNEGKDSYDVFTDAAEVVDGVDDISGMSGIMVETKNIVDLLDKMTTAANESIGNTKGSWKKMKDAVDEAKKKGWISPIQSTKGMTETEIMNTYLELAGEEYLTLGQLEDSFDKAVVNVKNASAKPSKPSSGGGGGGGGSSMSIGAPSGDALLPTPTYTEPELPPVAPFTDLAGYDWANEAITTLRRYNLVRGNGDGTYRPGESISREEFLAILLRLFDVKTENYDMSAFSDVDENAWYAELVATAYAKGIVKGYGDGRFGIGDNITRADMAVMILRMAKQAGINLDPVEKLIIFNDFADIPEYAYYDICVLQQANILNGDENGCFNATQPLTRAEAAVAFYGIFDIVIDRVTYTWMKTY